MSRLSRISRHAPAAGRERTLSGPLGTKHCLRATGGRDNRIAAAIGMLEARLYI